MTYSFAKKKSLEMVKSVRIENFKSIHELDLELGRLNIFIGENGCGKSNILEGIAMGHPEWPERPEFLRPFIIKAPF